MTTLDEEWLGGESKPIEERLLTQPPIYGGTSQELREEAAAEIRALRLLVKNQSKRIDELENELDSNYFDMLERDERD